MIRRLTDIPIRTHLTLLVLVAFLPALGFVVYTAVEQQRAAVTAAERRASLLVDELAESQHQVIAGTEQMLGTLAELPEVGSRDTTACNRLFAALLARYPHYRAIQAAAADGQIFASGTPFSGADSVADRKEFRDALRTGSYAAGEYLGNGAGSSPMLTFAQPVSGAGGRTATVLLAEADLELLGRAFSRVRLPPGATAVMTDSSGIILCSSPSAGRAVGTPDEPEMFRAMQAAGDRGTLPGGAGVSIAPLAVFGTIHTSAGAPPAMYIRVTLPEELVHGVAVQVFLRNFFLLLAIVVLALAITRLLVKRSLAEPIERLAETSRRLARGDLTVRTDLSSGRSELGELARAFDDMAQCLAAHESERNRTMEELERLTQRAIAEKGRTDAVIAAIGDGISIQGTDFVVRYQNAQHKALMGDCVGRYCYEAYEHNTTVCDNCPLAAAFDDRRIHTMERSALRPDGTMLHMEITASPVFDEEGNVTAGIEAVRDVTRRKRIDEELQQRNEALVRSNRELQQFAYVASHDLREPLRTITSFIQLLQRRYAAKLDRDADDFIAFIVDGAARMQQLIDDLLLYSRVESRGKEFAPVDSGQALQDALTNLTTAISDSGASITAESLPIVLGDDVQLVQLFQNLVGNAIKFRSDAAPVIAVGCSQDGNWWHFTVRDNGIGISTDSHDRIFDIFQKLHPRERYEGTGIGLSVCKKIVERHGGRIWVESSVGKGSTFHFTLIGAPP